MSCEHIKDELAIYFGQEELPQELRTHVEGCQECRAYWNELREMAVVMPGNDAFELEPWELEEAVAMVDRTIAQQPLPLAIRLRTAAQRWLSTLTDVRTVPAVAAVALVLIVSLGTTRFELSPPDPSLAVEVLSTSQVYFTATEDEIEDPDDAAVEALLSDFGQPWHNGTAETLLDDITDDEYDYLLQSLDVGDLL